jgi:hypothetical protein
MPSYDWRMVHLVDRKSGRRLLSAYSKHDWAKPATLAVVLNLGARAGNQDKNLMKRLYLPWAMRPPKSTHIPIATPGPSKRWITCVKGAPSPSGVKVMVRRPEPGMAKSVALYWSP